MTKAMINKEGVFLAKPGQQIEWGEGALSLSPNGAMQNIFASGTVGLAAWSEPNPQSTAYNRAIVGFGTVFNTPPIAYCALVRPDGNRELAMTMNLSTRSGYACREPQLWWRTYRDQLWIMSWWSLSTLNLASYVICYNEAD